MSELIMALLSGFEHRYELELASSGVVGAIIFPSLLAASQAVLFAPLRVSFSSSLLSSFFGLGAVTLASCGASITAMKTIAIIQQQHTPGSKFKPSTGSDLFLSTIGGVVVFRALGGRFAATLPSNLMRPGVFGRDWIPALRESQLASTREKVLVKSLGTKNGCHSCGRKRGVEFVADHQPPSKLLGNHRGGDGGGSGDGVDHLLQRFYPQCMECSHIQGGLLGGRGSIPISSSIAIHPKAIRTHMTSLRTYHLFLPLPFGVCYYHILNKNDDELPPSSSPPLIQTKDTQTDKSSDDTSASVKRSLTIYEIVSTFPLLVLWEKIAKFLKSFSNCGDAFHITLWAFGIIAALGTI